MEVKLTQVENGFILQITKHSPFNTEAPKVFIGVYLTLEEALEKIRS